MMSAQFSRIVWSALDSRQKHFSIGGDARRFDPQVHCFAAARDDTPGSLAALEALLADEDDSVIMLQRDPIRLPDALETRQTARGVLLVKRRRSEAPATTQRIRQLGRTDWPAVHDLAALTKPGPFKPRTPELGSYWGIEIDGRLAAMAGERLNLDGYTEVSGVCTHPDFRGRGYATALTVHVASAIEARGDTPFLHAYADNHGAISLYERLGFERLADVHVAVVGRQSGSGRRNPEASPG